MSSIRIDVTEEQHRKIKVLASMQGMTMKELVLEKVFSGAPYNKETIAALEAVEKGEGLTSYSNVDDLFKKLGI